MGSQRLNTNEPLEVQLVKPTNFVTRLILLLGALDLLNEEIGSLLGISVTNIVRKRAAVAGFREDRHIIGVTAELLSGANPLLKFEELSSISSPLVADRLKELKRITDVMLSLDSSNSQAVRTYLLMACAQYPAKVPMPRGVGAISTSFVLMFIAAARAGVLTADDIVSFRLRQVKRYFQLADGVRVVVIVAHDRQEHVSIKELTNGLTITVTT